ncbi:MAG: MFS transporter [Gammaproteobacteria bacterium]|nr:MFS transporter [Gammaproteobacteria bacterium]
MTSRPTNIRWRILAILAMGSFASYMLRSNVSIAAPAMMADLGLTEIQLGWILAAFNAGYAVFQFPGGILGDNLGPRKALTIIAALWGVTTILTIAVPGPDVAGIGVIVSTLMLVRFLVGATHAPIFPVQNSAISRWFPLGGWALPHGLSSTALTLGAAATGPLLPWLIDLFGWRASFLIIAPLGFVVAALWWWYARDFPQDHAAINESEIELITANQQPPVENLPPPPGWLRVLKNRDVILLMLSYSCMNFVFFEVFNWFYYYLVEVREFDLQTAGYVVSSQWIAGAAGAAIGGWLCDRLCHVAGLRWGCRWPIIIGLVASGVFLIAGAMHSNPMIAVTLLALCFFFNQLTEGTFWATSIAIGGQFAGSAGGIMNTGANAVGVLNALMIPWLAGAVSWPMAIASGGFFSFIGAGLLLFVRADRRIELD